MIFIKRVPTSVSVMVSISARCTRVREVMCVGMLMRRETRTSGCEEIVCPKKDIWRVWRAEKDARKEGAKSRCEIEACSVLK